jgi:hypothetical protein
VTVQKGALQIAWYKDDKFREIRLLKKWLLCFVVNVQITKKSL